MKKIAVSLLWIICGFVQVVLACTDVRITAKDGTTLIANSMQSVSNTSQNFCVVLQDRVFATTAPDGRPGLAWQAKNDYIVTKTTTNLVMSGVNEKGLSFAALYFSRFVDYQFVPVGGGSSALSYLSLGDWVLGNFDNVAQVRDALKNVYVYAQKTQQTGEKVFPLYFVIDDKEGARIIVEYIDSKLTVHDIKENRPPYDWHMVSFENNMGCFCGIIG